MVASQLVFRGKDGGFLRVKKVKASKKSQDLGRVGEITKVDIKLITELQDNGYIPVVAPIGSDNKGVSYNINADHAASKIASSLKAEKLIILTDVPGIQDEKGVNFINNEKNSQFSHKERGYR